MAKRGYFSSTIGKKQSMALAGLGLCVFVLVHAAGNMLLFKSPEAYNEYSHALVTNHLIGIIELGLLFIFLVHVIDGLIVSIRNRSARQTKNAIRTNGPKGTSLIKRTMILQGIIVFVFICLHLYEFKYGPYYSVTYNGVKMRDLYRLVHQVFQSPIYVVWYVVAVTILCFHLSHGLYSALQTLGMQNARYRAMGKAISVAFGILVTGMFAAQPIYMFLSTRIN